MPTKVVMPQMGESITEGTIVRWLKEVGEQVEKDEPLLEISTDKVDAEVPSPASGTLLKILHQDGDTVAVEEVIGLIGAEGEEAGGGEDEGEEKPAEGKPSKKKAGAEPAAAGGAGEEEEKPEKKAQGAKAPPKEPDEKRPRSSEKPPRNAEGEEPAKTAEKEEGEEEQESEEAAALRRRSSPVVRRIAAEHDIDLAEVEGTGIHGRVTKSDILDFIEEGKKAAPERPAPPAPSRAPGRRAAQPARAAGPHPGPSYAIGATRGPSQPFQGDELREGLSVMRQKIAEHMVESKRTSPHVHTIFEVDVSRVVALREREKEVFEDQHGIKLTYTPFFMAAAVEALKAFPIVNASIEGSEVVYHRHVNVGVAVALDRGLIVPVVKRAEELSIVGLQRAITDLATRARSKQLKPDDVHGSTFSITNPGPYGGLVGMPIINQPNVAILHVGNIHRRPLVITDGEGREAIAIRDVAYLALSFDHRLIDGATADQFMAQLKALLEEGSFTMG